MGALNTIQQLLCIFDILKSKVKKNEGIRGEGRGY